MPNLYPDLEDEVDSPDCNTVNMMQYISVGEALKLVAPFKGEKRDVLAFIANVDTEFELIDQRNVSILFKFLLTRISGEPRNAIVHRNVENWEQLKKVLRIHTPKRKHQITMSISCPVLSRVKQKVYQGGYSVFKS